MLNNSRYGMALKYSEVTIIAQIAFLLCFEPPRDSITLLLQDNSPTEISSSFDSEVSYNFRRKRGDHFFKALWLRGGFTYKRPSSDRTISALLGYSGELPVDCSEEIFSEHFAFRRKRGDHFFKELSLGGDFTDKRPFSF